MGPTWGRQDTDGPHVGHMNLANWGYPDVISFKLSHCISLVDRAHVNFNNGCDHWMTWWDFTMWQVTKRIAQIARFMWPTYGPPGSCRPQVSHMLATWTLLSGSPCNGGSMLQIFMDVLVVVFRRNALIWKITKTCFLAISRPWWNAGFPYFRCKL